MEEIKDKQTSETQQHFDWEHDSNDTEPLSLDEIQEVISEIRY